MMVYAHKFFLPKNTKFISEVDKLKEESKDMLPEVFSSELGRCKKMSTKFELNIQPVFKKKRNMPFASLNQIDKELSRFKQIGVLSKVATVYVKKKSKEICVRADFFTGLTLPSSKSRRYLCKTQQQKSFSKIDLSDTYLQIPMDEECLKLLCINTHWGLYKFE